MKAGKRAGRCIQGRADKPGATARTLHPTSCAVSVHELGCMQALGQAQVAVANKHSVTQRPSS